MQQRLTTVLIALCGVAAVDVTNEQMIKMIEAGRQDPTRSTGDIVASFANTDAQSGSKARVILPSWKCKEWMPTAACVEPKNWVYDPGEGLDASPVTVLLEEAFDDGYEQFEQYHDVDGTLSYSASASKCQEYGQHLCSRATLCPNGHAGGEEPAGGTVSGQWAPTSDSDNSWVSLGGYWPSCQLHSEIANGAHGKPGWGTGSTYYGFRKKLACCSDAGPTPEPTPDPTPPPTPPTSEPTSSPTPAPQQLIKTHPDGYKTFYVTDADLSSAPAPPSGQVLFEGPGHLENAFTTQVEASSTFAITFWLYIPSSYEYANSKFQAIAKMGTAPGNHPNDGTASDLNWFVYVNPRDYCGVYTGGTKLQNNVPKWNFANDAAVVHGTSGCPAPDRWNYISIKMTPSTLEYRVNGFLAYSGVKSQAWSDSHSGLQDLHVGSYMGTTAQDAGAARSSIPIRLADLTYHTSNVDAVMPLPQGIGQYVGATESGHCALPGVFVQNDPLNTTGFCFQFSMQPEPTCADNGGATVCTKAVVSSYDGFAELSYPLYAVVVQKVVKCDPVDETNAQHCTTTKSLGCYGALKLSGMAKAVALRTIWFSHLLKALSDTSTFATCDTFLEAAEKLVELGGHYPATADTVVCGQAGDIAVGAVAPFPTGMPRDDVKNQIDQWSERAKEMAITV